MIDARKLKCRPIPSCQLLFRTLRPPTEGLFSNLAKPSGLAFLDPFRAAVTGSDTKAHRPQRCRPFRVNPDCQLATFRRRRSLQNCPHYKRRWSELQQKSSLNTTASTGNIPVSPLQPHCRSISWLPEPASLEWHSTSLSVSARTGDTPDCSATADRQSAVQVFLLALFS